MKGSSPAEHRREIIRKELAKANQEFLWTVAIDKLGLENMGLESLKEMSNLLKNIRFYQEHVEVTRQTTLENGQALFHPAVLQLKIKPKE